MRKAQAVKLMKRIALVGLSLNMLAFTSPQKDDLVELRGLFNARKDSSTFRKGVWTNVVHTFPKGTRAVIVDTIQKKDGDSGICLDVRNVVGLDSSKVKCFWVYYDRSNPHMEFYSLAQDSAKRQAQLDAWAKDPKMNLKGAKVSTPETGMAAQTTATVEAVPQKKSVAATPAAATGKSKETVPSKSQPTSTMKYGDPMKKVTAGTDTINHTETVDTKLPAELAVKNITEFNKTGYKAMSTDKDCATCKKAAVDAYQTCNNSNSYIKASLDNLLSKSAYSEFFKAPQKEIISLKCVKDNMSYFPDSKSYFKTCEGASSGQRIGKACVSEDYVNVTAKSFNLAADCLGSYISGSDSTKNQTALSIFSLMAQESGMHMNAVSGTGPGGPGQMSNGAITDSNKVLNSVRSHLARQGNPNCSAVLGKVLEKPMRPSVTCDRIAMKNDNPMKGMAYAFIYQSILRKSINNIVNERLYPRVLRDLPADQKERLASELSAWAHNTGGGGIQGPLSAQLGAYANQGKSLKTAADVDLFLKNLKLYMLPLNGNAKIDARTNEKRSYYGEIQKKVNRFTKDRNSCLAI